MAQKFDADSMAPRQKSHLELLGVGLASFDRSHAMQAQMRPLMVVIPKQTVWGQVRDAWYVVFKSCEYYIDGPEAPSANGELLSDQSPRIITSFPSVTKSVRMSGSGYESTAQIISQQRSRFNAG